MRLDPIDWSKFKAEFPHLFGGDHPISLYVGLGWFYLCWELCEALEFISRERVEKGQLPIRIRQVKERNAGLCFLLEGSDAETDELTARVERQSTTICEACGQRGNLTIVDQWEKTLCLFHQLKAQSWRLPMEQ
jgi:hypothetical protein